MKLDDILQQFPDNTALRHYADQLKHEALELWLESPHHLHGGSHIPCTRAEIVVFACELRTQLAEFEDFELPAHLEIQPIVIRMVRLGEEQVAIELRSLQTYLDLLDTAEAIVIDSGATRAKFNAWVSHIDRLVNESRSAASVAQGLRDVRKLIDALLASAQ